MMRNKAVRWIPLFLMVACSYAAAAEPAPWPEIHTSMAKLDDCRALAMRGLKNAQDFKTASLYGRGWGLYMEEARAEDLIIEGLWLYDYLQALDTSSMSLVSYASAEQHPNVQQELDVLNSYLYQAAQRTLAYYEKTTRMLAEAIDDVNTAAMAKEPFEVREIPATGYDAIPENMKAAAGDGYNVGWAMPVVPGQVFGKTLDQFKYSRERMLKMARDAGIDFVRPWDTNTFNWADIETVKGKYDWTKVDEVCRRLNKYGLGMWMRIPSSLASPPQWMLNALGDDAVLVGPDGKRIEVPFKSEDGYMFGIQDERPVKYPINMFNKQVADAYCNWLAALVARVQQNGTSIYIAELLGGGDRGGALPAYAGDQAKKRFAQWVTQNEIDIRKRWGIDSLDQFEFPFTLVDQRRNQWELVTADTQDPTRKRMLIDFNKWREDEYIEYFRPQVQAIRKVYPQASICTTTSDYGEWNMSMAGRDDPRTVRELGLVPCGFSMENIWDNLRRSYSASHFSVGPTHSGAGDAYAQYAFSGYMHDTLGLYSLTHVRGFYWGDSIFYPDIRWEWTSLLGWQRYKERAQGMAPEMLNTAPAPQVALLWSATSAEYQSFIRDYVGGTYGFHFGPANYNKIGCVGWARILDSVGLSQDMVTEQQVLSGALDRYEMLVMPAVQALPANIAEKIRQYVANGGIVVATSAPALFGDDMEQHAGGQLADVFGADFAQFKAHSIVADSPLTYPVEDVFRNVWQRKSNTGVDQRKEVFCTYTVNPGASVVEEFADGSPAVVLNSFGKGKAMVVGYPIGKESFLSDVYHQHYGNNWQNIPYGSRFQQGIYNWFEGQFARLGFVRKTNLVSEWVPRITNEDAAWPSRNWPRAWQEYRDFTWKRGTPRGVDIILRKQENNPNRYLALFNREGSYGFAPGVIEFEAVNKQIDIMLADETARFLYDISLGCPVPISRGRQATFTTMLEPSCARMFVLSDDATLRKYAGNRTFGGRSDAEIRSAVEAVRAAADAAPASVVIGAGEVRQYLQERAREGILISCENQAWQSSAEKLAENLRVKLNAKVRITRTSPRIHGSHSFLWTAGQNFSDIEEPDIILGNRDQSHYVAQFGVHTGGMGNHTAPLPFMASESFPGKGSITCLTRPFRKKWSTPPREQQDGTLVVEESSPQTLVIGASNPAGVDDGVTKLIELLQ